MGRIGLKIDDLEEIRRKVGSSIAYLDTVLGNIETRSLTTRHYITLAHTELLRVCSKLDEMIKDAVYMI